MTGSFSFAHFWVVHTQCNLKAAAAIEGPGTALGKLLSCPVPSRPVLSVCACPHHRGQIKASCSQVALSRLHGDQLKKSSLSFGQAVLLRNTLSNALAYGIMHINNTLPTQPGKGSLELQKDTVRIVDQ